CSMLLTGLAVLFIIILVFFFFFQAEDGIRDATVTGVQTCALPISNTANLQCAEKCFCQTSLPEYFRGRPSNPVPPLALRWKDCRSEERRVGTELRHWVASCRYVQKIACWRGEVTMGCMSANVASGC